jgi:molybdopterin biosynthesis enzyme
MAIFQEEAKVLALLARQAQRTVAEGLPGPPVATAMAVLAVARPAALLCASVDLEELLDIRPAQAARLGRRAEPRRNLAEGRLHAVRVVREGGAMEAAGVLAVHHH